MVQISKHDRSRVPRTPRQAASRRGEIDRVLDAELFKGLSDPTRLRLLACLAKCGRGCTVSEVAACCAVDFSVVSRHLAQLERSGIVGSAKQGRAVIYTVRYAEMSARLRAIADALTACCPAAGACCAGAGGCVCA